MESVGTGVSFSPFIYLRNENLECKSVAKFQLKDIWEVIISGSHLFSSKYIWGFQNTSFLINSLVILLRLLQNLLISMQCTCALQLKLPLPASKFAVDSTEYKITYLLISIHIENRPRHRSQISYTHPPVSTVTELWKAVCYKIYGLRIIICS